MSRLTIERLSHDGRGVARHDGKVAFVTGALSGEVVEAALAQQHRRFDEYRLVDVLEASPDRVEPRCPLTGRCGGCDLQHLAGPAQIAHKTQVLVDQIRRQSGLTPEHLLPPLSADAFAYRRRTRLAVAVPRRGGRPVLGLRTAGSSEVVPIDRCPVLVPELAALPGRLQSLLNDLENPAALGHVELTLAETDGQAALPLVYLRLVAAPSTADRSALSSFARAERSYLALRVGDGAPEYLHRPEPEDPGYRLPEFDLRLAYPPGGFIQGNAGVNRALVHQVVAWVTEVGSGSVLDAFCGVGNFTLPLARRGLKVLGVEVSPEAVARARLNADRNGLAVAFVVHDLMQDARKLQRDLFDTAVLDPPRTGARALIGELADRRVANVIYVSCAPSTLARDAAILADAGYALEKLCPVDMFPQTSHIESVSMFRLDGRQLRRR